MINAAFIADFGSAHRAFKAADPPAPDPVPYPLIRVSLSTLAGQMGTDEEEATMRGVPTFYAVRDNGDVVLWPRPAGNFPALFVGPYDPGPPLPEPEADDAPRDA